MLSFCMVGLLYCVFASFVFHGCCLSSLCLVVICKLLWWIFWWRMAHVVGKSFWFSYIKMTVLSSHKVFMNLISTALTKSVEETRWNTFLPMNFWSPYCCYFDYIGLKFWMTYFYAFKAVWPSSGSVTLQGNIFGLNLGFVKDIFYLKKFLNMKCDLWYTTVFTIHIRTDRPEQTV